MQYNKNQPNKKINREPKFINSPQTGFSLAPRGLMSGINCLYQQYKGASA